MELELDGEPKNRQQQTPAEDSPHATRWRLGEQEIVGALDLVTGVVRIRVGSRDVGELPAHGGGSVRFTVAAGSGYRGGDQVEARIHRDARTGTLTLWVDGIEVAPIARPEAVVPSPPFVALPPPSDSRGPSWLRVALIMALVGLIGVPTYLYVRERDGNAMADLEAKTAACMRRADAVYDEAVARHGSDPKYDDQRRLARISCKQHERDCKRDPRSLICLMDPK